MAAAVVQLIIAIFVFGVILLFALYVLWQLVRKDTVRNDMEQLWDHRFTIEEMEYKRQTEER